MRAVELYHPRLRLAAEGTARTISSNTRSRPTPCSSPHGSP
jgi:hypothetical protein